MFRHSPLTLPAMAALTIFVAACGPATTPDDDAAVTGAAAPDKAMSAAEIREFFDRPRVLAGSSPSGDWRATYSPDGEIVGRKKGYEYVGSWWLRGNVFCTSYARSSKYDKCFFLRRNPDGDVIEMVRVNGQQVIRAAIRQ